MTLRDASQQTFDCAVKNAKHRPTVGLDGAKHLLDLNEDYILDLCADRKLSHSWNIGVGAKRREVRILRASIDHYIAYGSAPLSLTDDQLLSVMLPPLLPGRQSIHDREWVTNGELQRSLNCVSDHVLHLVDAKELRLRPRTSYRRGPNGSAQVTIASFRSFLERRRLPC